jgi:predicted kinase
MAKSAYILIGLPASGKSTYREECHGNRMVISTDDIIEDIADRYGFNYNDIFKSAFKFAEQVFWDDFKVAIEDGEDIIIDRTNLSVKSRSKFLSRLIENNYEVTAVIFPTPELSEWNRRLDSRPGKTIPADVLENMMASFEVPTLEEGFIEVFVMGDDDNDENSI